MFLAPMALVLLTAAQPAKPGPTEPLRLERIATVTRPVLREAVRDAARSTRLERERPYRRGEPYRLSPRAGRMTAGIIIGAAAGFMGSLVTGFALSRECGPPLSIVIAATAGGGALGGYLAR